VVSFGAMIVLCLDVGTRRTGVAVSDPTGTLARPLTTLHVGDRLEDLVPPLRELICETGAELLVVGLPRRLSGAHGPEAERAETLASGLEKALGVATELCDERLTTLEAERLLGERGVRGRKRRERLDQAAAAVILQGYLDGPRAVEPENG
jgi:putative Holliday junction resolvase